MISTGFVYEMRIIDQHVIYSTITDLFKTLTEIGFCERPNQV